MKALSGRNHHPICNPNLFERARRLKVIEAVEPLGYSGFKFDFKAAIHFYKSYPGSSGGFAPGTINKWMKGSSYIIICKDDNKLKTRSLYAKL